MGDVASARRRRVDIDKENMILLNAEEAGRGSSWSRECNEGKADLSIGEPDVVEGAGFVADLHAWRE